MKDDELVIRIKEDKTVKVEIRENGVERSKYISPDTLFECIEKSIEEIPVRTGLLPDNIISVKMNTKGRDKFAVVEYMYSKADITYMNTTYKDFPLPRLIFGFKIENSGRISSVCLGVTETGKLTENSKMYYYPFSNVNGFSLCTGANALPHINSLRQLKNLPEYILSLPDNDDHYNSKYNKSGLGHRDLLEHLKDKDSQYYYDNVLIPMPGRTLKNFI